MPSSFQPPVSGGPSDPYEKYRVEEIQKDRDAEVSSKKTEQVSQDKRSAFAAYVSLVFKKFLEIFENTSDCGLALSAENDVQEHLILFKTALEILKTDDKSQDSAFLNRLSHFWHQMLEDTLRFRRQTPLSVLMRTFIKELQNYPQFQEHSLGYYLTEYAGQTWLPFPYMEMIHRLHSQHLKNPSVSSLSHWTDLLNKMIQMLTPSKQE